MSTRPTTDPTVDPSLDEVDAAFAAVITRRHAQADHERAASILWRTHHWPERYERCAVIGGRHVCRRCVWFYGIAFSVVVLGFAGISPWPTGWDAVLVWALSIPATLEFGAGELGLLRYDARRQVIVTAILAPAVGRGMYASLTDPGSWLFWGPVLTFGPIWFVVAVVGWFRRSGQYRA